MTGGVNSQHAWSDEGATRVPDLVYRDADLCEVEQKLASAGPFGTISAWEVEILSAGDYIIGRVGDTPVIVVRTAEGGINAQVNRCAHKGSMIYHRPSGHMSELTCPYRNWVYDFAGNLKSVAFRHGVRGQGGMPAGVTCGFASAPSCSTRHQLTPCW